MHDSKFMQRLIEFNKDGIQPKELKMLQAYTQKPDFTPEIVAKESTAASVFCMWVCAIEFYARCS